MTHLGNSSANHTLSPLQRACSLKLSLAYGPLQILSLYRARRALEYIGHDPARLAYFLRRRRLDEHTKQRRVGIRQQHRLNPRVCGKALEERVGAAVHPLQVGVRREVRLERCELVQVRRCRTVADEDCLQLCAVCATRDAALSAEIFRRGWRRVGSGRREGGEGVADELAEQARIDACADHRDLFLRERGVREGACVLRRQLRAGRGKKGCTETRMECEGVGEVERGDRWVVRRLCDLRGHGGEHALGKLVRSVPGFGQYAC